MLVYPRLFHQQWSPQDRDLGSANIYSTYCVCFSILGDCLVSEDEKSLYGVVKLIGKTGTQVSCNVLGVTAERLILFVAVL